MNHSGSFRPTASMKAAVVIVEILFYLGIVAVILSIALTFAVNLTGLTVKYTHAPIEVAYCAAPGISPFGQDLSTAGPKVIGMIGIVLEHSQKGLQRVYVLIPLALAGLFLAVIMMLRRIVRSIKSGTPFTRENAARIKALGWVIALAGPFYGLLDYVYGLVILSQIDIPDATSMRVDPDARLLYVVAGIIIIVIGHVFDYGVRLREEADLTI